LLSPYVRPGDAGRSGASGNGQVQEPLSRSVQGSSTAQHAARKRAETREDEHAGRVRWRLLGSCREANKFTGQANGNTQRLLMVRVHGLP